MSREKRDRILDIAFFVVLLAAVSAVTLVLFHRQTLGSPERYHSDMKAYILEMQGKESGYSFPYPVFFKISAFFHLFLDAELSVAVATMLLNSLGIALVKLMADSLLFGGRPGSWREGFFTSLMAVSLFFISMLYPPEGIYLPGIRFKYLGVFSPNPFHNATYMAARPFAVLAFWWYGKLLPVYEKEEGKAGDYLLFSVFLLLATMTKPSFTLVMVSTAGLIMLYRLIRSGFRNWRAAIRLGLCFVPTFLDLLYQFQGVFVPSDGTEGGVGLCFGEVWAQYCKNIPLAVCLLMAFPLTVLVFQYRELKTDALYRFSWQLFLVGLAEAFLLYEKGFRKVDFNFSWGYMCGAFFCHMCSLLLLARKSAEALRDKGNGTGDGKRRMLFLAAQWLVYLWHLFCGVLYFAQFMRGAMYY